RLDYEWYRPLVPGVPQERWALEATGTITLGEGLHTLRTISDDAVRVWVDGQLVIDNWTPHESLIDTAVLGPGTHDVRVQFVQVGGWTELRLDVLPGVVRSEGSPGPH
ncbi:MAG TPA: PA14 domain-containing protein, partial [Rhodothermales bacterium]|nr:PA14 domain-containing protein [Rhodothermales bacterium]